MTDFFANEAATISLFSGAMGAFFGAVGAQFIATRSDKKRSIQLEINKTRSARAICFSICNQYLSLKKQHTKSLIEDYEKSRLEVIEKLKKHLPNFEMTINFEANMHTLPFPHSLVKELQNTLFLNVSLNEKSFSCLNALSSSIAALEETIKMRNEMISRWQNEKIDPMEFAYSFLGIENKNGQDTKYKDTMEGIKQYLDDCIFFSSLLDSLLVQHHNKLISNKIYFLSKDTRMYKTIWVSKEHKDLIPDDSEYQDWLKGFVTPDKWYKQIWMNRKNYFCF
ncbi:hypothetical protein [Roseibium aggregatum]|uniref:hypothetical protein n=1 Tax=Roseibium aggregatum TaxID=187304 RepID=UPI00094B583C|nr:hypothetical protein [Roseibium aggregatum]UFI05960.1 hypothetical protein ST40_012780 [Roseibium aggregatum]